MAAVVTPGATSARLGHTASHGVRARLARLPGSVAWVMYAAALLIFVYLVARLHAGGWLRYRCCCVRERLGLRPLARGTAPPVQVTCARAPTPQSWTPAPHSSWHALSGTPGMRMTAGSHSQLAHSQSPGELALEQIRPHAAGLRGAAATPPAASSSNATAGGKGGGHEDGVVWCSQEVQVGDALVFEAHPCAAQPSQLDLRGLNRGRWGNAGAACGGDAALLGLPSVVTMFLALNNNSFGLARDPEHPRDNRLGRPRGIQGYLDMLGAQVIRQGWAGAASNAGALVATPTGSRRAPTAVTLSTDWY